MRRIIRALSGAVLLIGAGFGSREACGQFAAVGLTSGLTRPVFVTCAPGDYRRLFIVEKRGRIRSLDNTTDPPGLQSGLSPFLDVTTLIPNITSDKATGIGTPVVSVLADAVIEALGG